MSDRRLQLEVITPGGVVFRDVVDYVEAPGVLGFFGILPGHAPFLSQIGSGRLQYRQGEDDHFLAVEWGFVEVHEDEVIVLTETAEPADDIELAGATAFERARSRRGEFGTAYAAGERDRAESHSAPGAD